MDSPGRSFKITEALTPDAPEIAFNEAKPMDKWRMRLNPGLAHAKALELDERTRRGEDNYKLKENLLEMWADGPFSMRTKARELKRKVRVKVGEAYKALEETLEPLEVLEARMKQAEDEALARGRKHRDDEMNAAISAEVSYLEDKKQQRLKALELERKRVAANQLHNVIRSEELHHRRSALC